MNSINSIIKDLGIKAKKASNELANVQGDKKNKALNYLKKNLKLLSSKLIEVNKIDIQNAHDAKLSSAKIDRLTLNEDRIHSMVFSLDEIINQKNPVGVILSEWDRPNGLHFQKITVPIGVIGIIYESRPNVTIDASAIAVKAGNAVILRGGKDSFNTSKLLCSCINDSFDEANLPKNIVQMIPIPERSAVDAMLKLDSYIDLIIPRGGKGLIKNVKENSSIPVIKHLDGICHVYVDKDADLNIAKEVVFNSKMRRPGICGAAETLLIDKKLSEQTMVILKKLMDSKCEIRGDKFVKSLNNNIKLADEKDWGTEYLDKIISVKMV